MRVVSLIASSTEVVCALGCGDLLVGRSHECDYPFYVRQLPVCSQPKFNVDGTSAQIDERVKTIVRDGLSVYRIDTQRLKDLKPDLIITQDHCEVCAVSLKDVQDAVCHWLDGKVKIVSLRPNQLSDVWKGIKEIAEVLGCPDQAGDFIRRCQDRMSGIEAAVKNFQQPTVACIEWIEPLMCAGNWVPELVKMAGGNDVLGTPGKHSPWMRWEQLQKADPDVIIIMPCGWNIDRSRQEMRFLTQHSGWHQLKAVKQGKVFLTDGNQYFNRPGPRLAESLEILAEILFPNRFSFGHRGLGWEPF